MLKQILLSPGQRWEFNIGTKHFIIEIQEINHTNNGALVKIIQFFKGGSGDWLGQIYEIDGSSSPPSMAITGYYSYLIGQDRVDESR
jgi:hypothetical protein